MPPSLTQTLRLRRPLIHEGGRTCAGLSWAALEWLERNVSPGATTLETGAGLSTIVFAASGAHHTAITPVADEADAIRRVCDSLGVDHSGVEFVIEPSEIALPKLDPRRPLDVVLVDGAHGFPYAILDWWYLRDRLRVGGAMLLDDAYLPPVLAILDGLKGVPSWRVDGPISDRTVLLHKTGDALPPTDWPGGPFGGRQSYRYLPTRRRIVAGVRERLVATELGQRAVRARRSLEARRGGTSEDAE